MANVYQDPIMRQVLARLVRSNMDLCGMTYKDLCHALAREFGIEHNPATLRNKVSSGSLGAQMLLFMLLVMDVDQLRVKDIQNMYEKIKEKQEVKGGDLENAE